MELETLDVRALKPVEASLQRLSFAGNNFTCDDKLGPLITFVDNMYEVNSSERLCQSRFLQILNSRTRRQTEHHSKSRMPSLPTARDRSTSRYDSPPPSSNLTQDTPLLTLNEDELSPYDPLADTTPVPTTTTPSTNIITLGPEVRSVI